MPPLENPKHELYAQALAKGIPSKDAYEQAGYQFNEGNASRLKSNEKVAARVMELIEKGAEKAEVSVERVLKELARLSFQDPRKMFTGQGGIIDIQDLDDDTAAAVAGIEVVRRQSGETDENGNPVYEYVHKIKTWDKNSALDKLAKHLSLYAPEKHEHSGPGGKPIQTEEVSARESVTSRIAGLAARSAAAGDT